MKSFYSLLTESINNKYLTEAWSDSMPDWVKKRLNQQTAGDSKAYNSKIYKKAYETAENAALANGDNEYRAAYTARDAAARAYNKAKFGIDSGRLGDTSEYASPRGSSYLRDSEKALCGQFQRLGIDLTSPDLKFISGEPPKSSKDPRVQPPHIPIWGFRLPNGGVQVYARRINDLEKIDYSIDAGPYSELAFMRISIKKLSELCDYFCYIDGNTLQYQNPKKIQDRENNNAWSRSLEGQRLTRNKDFAGGAIGGQRVDKSGYIIIPSAEKYAEQLKRLHLKNWSKDLLEVEELLNSTYNRYINALSSLPFKDAAWNSKNRSIPHNLRAYSSTFFSSFEDAVDIYSKLLREIDEARHNTHSEADFLKALEDVRFEPYIRNIKDFAKQASESISEIAVQEIDF